MNLQLNVPPQLELVLKKRAAEAGVDVQTYVLETLSLLESDCIEPNQLTHAEFAMKLDKIKAIHAKANGNFDDSRDSIYVGRGE